MEGVTLCLYCDKAFKVSDETLREDHVNSEHFYFVEGRRTSSRTEKKVVEIENPKYPGCFYCNSGKKCIKVNDLNLLYSHLSQKHYNEYFACKKCKLRFTDIHSFRGHQKICKFCKRHVIKEGKRTFKKLDKSLPIQRNIVHDGIAEKCDSLKEKIESNMTLPNKNAILKKSENRSKSKTRKKPDKSADTMQASPDSSVTNGEEYNILTRHKKSVTMNEPTLFRLGVTQNRSPTRQCSKNKQSLSNTDTTKTSPQVNKVFRTKSTKVSVPITASLEAVDIPKQPEVVNTDFDEDFYKSISTHIKDNLNSFVDGKMSRNNLQLEENSLLCSMSSVLNDERVIYQATDFDTVMPFPALLTQEQYGSDESNQNKIKRHITKNSWKWKWDLIKKYKYVNEGGKIVKKVKQITTGQRDLSKLDMWTQLSMRTRYDNICLDNTPQSSLANVEMASRIIKSQNLEQLNDILDKRQMPNIVHEQNDQTVIKLELVEPITNLYCDVPPDEPPEPNILKMFNLRRRYDTITSNANLSGEWARPRCYICSDCGQKFDLIKALEDHKNAEHPYVVSSHYEIVGRENLEKKFYKNLFFTKKAFLTHNNAYRDSSHTPVPILSDANEISSDASVKLQDMSERECTKCRKTIRFASDVDLYRHILDCAGDTIWLQAKRRMKYRRSQRRRRVSNKSSASKRSKNLPVKEEGDRPIRSRPEVLKDSPSFTEIEEDKIQRMLAELPAKRNDRKSTSAHGQSHPAGRSKRIQKILKNAKIKASKEPNNIKQFFKVSKKGANGKKNNSCVASDSTNNDHTRKVLRSAKKSVSNAEIDTNNRINAVQLTNTTKTNKISGKRKCNKFILKEIENTKIEELEELVIENVQLSEDQDKKELFEVGKNEPILPVNNETQANLSLAKKDVTESFTEKSLKLSSVKDTFYNEDSSKSEGNPCHQPLKIVTTPTAPKKKVKKLNDCIARLTCKIQEKLGVSFFESTCSLLSPTQSDNVEREVLDLSLDKSFSQNALEHMNDGIALKNEVATANLLTKISEKTTDTSNEEINTKTESTEHKCLIEITTDVLETPKSLPGAIEDILNVNTEHVVTENSSTDEDTLPLKDYIKKIDSTPIFNTLNKNPESVPSNNKNVSKISEKITPEPLKIPRELNGLKHQRDIVASIQKETINLPEAPLPIIKTIKIDQAIGISKKIPKNVNEKLEVQSKSLETILSKKVTFLEDEKITKIKETLTPISPKLESVVQSVKVSIPKTKLPKLNEILFQYQTITVNNIKISLPERQAFEEQKSRIMKILNKAHNAMAIKESLTRNTRKIKETLKKAKHAVKGGSKSANKITKNLEKTSKVVSVKLAKEKKVPIIPLVEEVIEPPIRVIRPRRMSVAEPVYVQKITATVMRPRRMSVADRRLEATAVTITKKVIAGKKSKISIPKTIDMIDRKNVNKKISLEILDNVLISESSITIPEVNRKEKETKNVLVEKRVTNDKSVTQIKLSVQESEMISEALDDVPLARINKTFEKSFVESFLEKQRSLETKQESDRESETTIKSYDKLAIPKRLNGIRQRRLTIAESHFNTVRYPSNSKKPRTTNNSQQNEFYDGILKVSDSTIWDPKTFNKTTIELPKTMNRTNNNKNKSKKVSSIQDSLVLHSTEPKKLIEGTNKQKAPLLKSQLTKAPVLKAQMVRSKESKKNDISLESIEALSTKISNKIEEAIEKSQDTKTKAQKIKSKILNTKIEPSQRSNKKMEFKEISQILLAKTKSEVISSSSVKPETVISVLKNEDKKSIISLDKYAKSIKSKYIPTLGRTKALMAKNISTVSKSQENILIEKAVTPILKSIEATKNVKFSTPISDLNEDSLFNDDENEVEFSDIVNNIINSSELIDFDDDECINLKNSVKLNDSKDFASSKYESIDDEKRNIEDLTSSVDKIQIFRCQICSKNYATNKSLQKHYTTNLHNLNNMAKASKEAIENEVVFNKINPETIIVEVAKAKKNREKTIESVHESTTENAPTKCSQKSPARSAENIQEKVTEKSSATPKQKVPQCFSHIISTESKSKDLRTAFRSKGALKVFELPLPKLTTCTDKIGGDGILNDIFDKLCNTATMNNRFDSIRSSNQINESNTKPVEKISIFSSTSTTKTKDFEENLKRSKINFANLLDANRMKTAETLFDHIKGMDKIIDLPNQIVPEISKETNQKTINRKPVLFNKVNKIKETNVSLPTKSLIMGKIFKKQNKDKSKVEISSESDCKNDLDRIFDHLKNTDEIDDRILTCSPTQSIITPNIQIEPVKNEPFKMEISNGVSTDDEDACINSDDEVSIGHPRNKKRKTISVDNNFDFDKGFVPEGKRKSSRKCAIKAKTFAETWSSDEYEEFHNFDVIQLIDEIEKKNSDVAKRMHKKNVKEDIPLKKQNEVGIVDVPEISSLSPIETTNGKNHYEPSKPEKLAKKDKKPKSSEVVDIIDSEDESLRSIMMKVPGQKKQFNNIQVTEDKLKKEKKLNKFDMQEKIYSGEDTIVKSTDKYIENHKKPHTFSNKIKKAKKSQPEIIESEGENINIALEAELLKVTESKLTKVNIENIEPQPATIIENHHIENTSRKEKLEKKIANNNNNNNNNNHQSTNCNNIKKKLLKGRKKRNRPKNMAYDSDSDFELNLHKKHKLMLNQGTTEAEELSDCHKSTAQVSDNETYKSDRKLNDQLSQRDLTDNLMADVGDGEAANRTKRISSEKLYYWSSSSSGSEADQDEDGRSFVEKLDEDKNELPQHGWIVGDSHKKLVKLLAHAKIKKKIN